MDIQHILSMTAGSGIGRGLVRSLVQDRRETPKDKPRFSTRRKARMTRTVLGLFAYSSITFGIARTVRLVVSRGDSLNRASVFGSRSLDGCLRWRSLPLGQMEG